MNFISVIVPVYKVEKVLHYCVDSILGQSYESFELILVDDGSPDGSGKICDEYAAKDSRVRVIHKPNGGVSSARNAGIAAAKGDYVCFIDSDDYVHPDYLKTLVEFKSKYPDYDSIWCRFDTVSDYPSADNPKKNETSDCKKYTINDISTLHEMWVDAGPYCKLYDVKILNEYSLKFDESLSLGEDLMFNWGYLDKSNKKILLADAALYYYVQASSESLDSKYRENLFDIYKMLHGKMFYYAKKWNIPPEQHNKIYDFAFWSYERALRNTFSPENKQPKSQKYRTNKEIMHSREFKTALKNMTGYLNPLYKAAYKTGSYRAVRPVDKIVSLKHK